MMKNRKDLIKAYITDTFKGKLRLITYKDSKTKVIIETEINEEDIDKLVKELIKVKSKLARSKLK